MTGLKILAGALLGLFLLGLIRLGARATYSQEGLYVRLRLGKFSFQVYPFKKREREKPPRKKKEKPSKPAVEKPEQTRERGGPLELVKQALPVVCQAAGELKRKIRIDTLWLELTVAADNAAAAAMAYGYANMVIGMLWPLIEQNFEVIDPRIDTRVGYNGDATAIYINAALSMRLGQLVSLALRSGLKLLRIYLRTRPRTNSKKEAIGT